MKQSSIILVAFFFISTVSVINCDNNVCSMNFEECEFDSDCCSKNCLMVSLPPFCYKDDGQTDEVVQSRLRRDLCSFHHDSKDSSEIIPDPELSEIKVYYNFLSNNTIVLLTINGISHMVVTVNDQKTQGNETSQALRLSQTTAELFEVESEGSVSCHFEVVDPETLVKIVPDRVVVAFYGLGIVSFVVGIAMITM